MIPQRIVHLEFGQHLYGGAYQVLALLRHGCVEGFQHTLVTPTKSALADTLAVDGSGVDLRRIPFAGELDLRLFFALRRAFRLSGAHLVHVHSRRGADLWGVQAARSIGLPVVVSRRVDNRESRIGVRLKFAPALAVVGISREICRVLAAQGVAPEKIHCIPSGIDTSLYRPRREAAANLRQTLGLPPEAQVVAMVAQFIPRKGHATVIAAFPRILQAHPKAHAVLFGQGPLLEQMQADTRLLPQASRFHFPGFRQDLADLLPGIDVLVHPAHKEGLGVALLQAGACAKPLVGGRAGGIPEIVRDGETGFLVTPGDPTELAGKVIRILDDPTLAQRLGEQARQHINRSFSEQTMAESNLRLYQKILSSETVTAAPSPPANIPPT